MDGDQDGALVDGVADKGDVEMRRRGFDGGAFQQRGTGAAYVHHEELGFGQPGGDAAQPVKVGGLVEVGADVEGDGLAVLSRLLDKGYDGRIVDDVLILGAVELDAEEGVFLITARMAARVASRPRRGLAQPKPSKRSGYLTDAW